MLNYPTDPDAPVLPGYIPVPPTVVLSALDLQGVATVDDAPGRAVGIGPPTPGPNGFGLGLTFRADGEPTFDLPTSPVAGDELAPTAVLELAPANDGADVESLPDVGLALRAFRSFFGGESLAQAEDRDAFSFGDFVGGSAVDDGLDPFLDAIDPAWTDDVMRTFLADGTGLADMLPDPLDPMIDIPVDGADGWVV